MANAFLSSTTTGSTAGCSSQHASVLLPCCAQLAQKEEKEEGEEGEGKEEEEETMLVNHHRPKRSHTARSD